MLTKEELDGIEKWLDDLGIPPGLYRDGYRACMRNTIEFTKTMAFGEMAQRMFLEAALQACVEVMVKDSLGRVQPAGGEKP